MTMRQRRRRRRHFSRSQVAASMATAASVRQAETQADRQTIDTWQQRRTRRPGYPPPNDERSLTRRSLFLCVSLAPVGHVIVTFSKSFHEIGMSRTKSRRVAPGRVESSRCRRRHVFCSISGLCRRRRLSSNIGAINQTGNEARNVGRGRRLRGRRDGTLRRHCGRVRLAITWTRRIIDSDRASDTHSRSVTTDDTAQRMRLSAGFIRELKKVWNWTVLCQRITCDRV